MTAVLVIFVICVFALLAWVILKMVELDERQVELDKYSVHLDERANKLALWEKTMIPPKKVVYQDVSEDGILFSATYCISESDTMMYTTDKAVRSNAENKIALTIAHDIVKKIPPHEETTDDGYTKLSYRFNVIRL